MAAAAAAAGTQWARRNDLSPAQIMVKCSTSAAFANDGQTGLVSHNARRAQVARVAGEEYYYWMGNIITDERSVTRADNAKRPGRRVNNSNNNISILNPIHPQ